MQPIGSIAIYTYETSKNLVSEKEVIKWNSTKMINFDDAVKENIKKHPDQPQIPDHPYRTLIFGGSGLRKKTIFESNKHAKDPYKAKYQFLINKKVQNAQKSTGVKHFNDPKAFIEYSNDMDDTYQNIKEWNPNKDLEN